MCLLDFVVTLNDHPHHSVDTRLLTFHLRSELPDSAEFLEEDVQRAVAVDQDVRMKVEVLGHVI